MTTIKVQIATDTTRKTTYCPPYLTPGREYSAKLMDADKQRYNIQDDKGYECTIRLEGCFHLRGGDWDRL